VDRERAWAPAVALGVVMGLSMLTRQGLSYTLWGLPVVAVFLQAARPRGATAFSQSDVDAMNVVNPGSFGSVIGSLSGRAIGQFVMALVIALAIWAPYLTANFDALAKENGGPVPELKRRILYQTQFTAGTLSMPELAVRNINKTFVPSHKNDEGERETLATSGWMFLYLTPAVFVACVLGVFYLAFRGEWLAFFFLLTWAVLMLGPVIMMGNVIYSRYVLAGVPPLLIVGACLVTEVLVWIVSRRGPAWVTWTVAGLVLAGLLILPLREIGNQAKYWSKQVLTQQDRYQYITGTTSGLAVRSAIQAIERDAREGPLVVITDAGWGNPADAAWVYLSRNPNVKLYWRNPEQDGPVILQRARSDPDVVLLRKDKFLFGKPEPVKLEEGVPVFLLTQEPLGGTSAEEYFRRSNPNLGQATSFNGIDSGADADRVILIQVR
jgi:hypothetical protein